MHGGPAQKAKQPKPKQPPAKPDPLVPDLTPPIQEAQRQAARQQRKSAAWLQRHSNRGQAVMQRQRVLRSAGYHVAVDGIWGPQSQQAWHDYTTRRAHGEKALGAPYAVPKTRLPAPARLPGSNLQLARDRAASVRATAADARQTAEEQATARSRADLRQQAKRDAKRQMEAQRARVQAIAARISADPNAASQLTLRKLTDALVDPDVGLGVTTHAGALAAQTWLDHHGYQVKRSGAWDKQTHDAFLSALHDEERRIRQHQNQAVIHQLYQPAGLHPGDTKPSWMYGVQGDRVPRPGELLDMLQKGGFASRILYRNLIEHAKDGNWTAYQHGQLLRIAGKIQPFALPLGGFGLQPSNAQLYAELALTIPQLRLSPYGGDYGARDEARRQASLIAQADALYKARDRLDFQTKLSAYTALEEQKQLRLQQETAAHHVGWFGHGVSVVMRPGAFLRTALVTDTNLLFGSLDRTSATPGFLDYASMSEDQRGRLWDDAQHAIQDANPISRFAYEAVIDPLNLLAVGRLGSTMLRFGTKGTMLGRYTLISGAELARGTGLSRAVGWKLGADTILNRSIRYQAGTWSKFGAITHGLDAVTGGHFSQSKAYTAAQRGLATKEEALARVREKVALAMRHGFKTPAHPSASGINVYTPKGGLSQKLDQALTDLVALHGHDPTGTFTAIRDILQHHHASLWMDASKTTLSNVGASIEAYLAETYSAQIAHRIAAEAARDALTNGAAQEAARAEYQRVLDSVGSFLGPRGSRAAALDDATKAIQATHRAAVSSLLDEVRHTWFRAWQHLVEDNAARQGVNLWDEQGLWALRHGDTAETLRALARDTFERGTVPIQNPHYGIAHTYVEASEAMESEIQRLSSRAQAYDERMTVGQYDSNFNVLDKLEAIRDEVKGHWQERNGFWYDTRPEVEVSSLYARHLAAATDGARAAADSSSFLAHIGQAPRDTRLSYTPLNDALDRFAWRTGGRGRASGLKPPHPASPQHLADAVNPAVVGNEAADAELAFAADIAEAVNKHQAVLSRAYDEALPHAMKEELLVWQALLHAQTAPLRIAAKALQAGLNLWIFATLPLRAGWTVRNIVDNVSKNIIAGMWDPRFLFLGAERPGSGIRTVFDTGFYPLRQTVRFLDQLFGTDVLHHLDTIIDHIWGLPASILRRIFTAHGIDVPEHAISDMKFDPIFRQGSRDSHRPQVVGEEAAKKGYTAKSMDALWELFGNRPEAYWRRTLYRHTVAKETARLKREAKLLNRAAIDRPLKVSIDRHQARTLADRFGGKNATDIEVVFQEVPHEQMLHDGMELRGYYRHYEDLAATRAEYGDFVNHYIVVHVPSNVNIASRQEAQVWASNIANTFLHELRHSTQYSRRSIKLDRAVSDRLPYRYKSVELDARTWAKLRKRLGHGLVKIDPNLPSIYDETAIAAEAHRLALQKVEDTLFDYSKLTVVEDNLRAFFPFIQFWRKNTGFWLTNAIDKPWLPLAYTKWEAELNDAHSDLPQWMRRYLSTRELVDAAAVVPGLDKVVSVLIPQDAMYDPLKFSSGAPLYRSFLNLMGEQENQNLPPGEGNGWPIIGPMLNAINEWGLGVNPLIEKPLENAGVASYRGWQTIFPQAGPLIALNPDFWLQRQKSGPIEWARIVALNAMGADPDAVAKNYDYYVNAEIADQVARGEHPDRARATKVIQDWFLTQNLVGYFSGMYLRRATPSDIYMSKLYDDAITGAHSKFSERERELLKLWAMRGADRYSFDRYLEAVPDIRAYYKQPDYQAAQSYLDQHPELTPYVDPTWRGHPFSHNYIQQAAVHYDADTFFRISQLSDTLDVAYDVRQAASTMLLTPEIKAMWERNSTPAERRRRMLEGLIHQQLDKVNQGYFQIPETNHQARRDYLGQHPELIRLWNAHNEADDDYRSILHSANAELRQRFFTLIDQGKHDAADAFLRKHPFLWEDTKHADRFDPQTGQLKLQYMSARARAYLAAKPAFDKLDALIARVGRKAAWNWLYTSDDPDAQAARAYLKTYAHSKGHGRSDHARDYLAVRSILKAYFNMPPAIRERWLHGDSPEAKQLRTYFAKWASDKGMTQHARDYLAAKSALDHYFSLSKSRRRTWLKAGSPDARTVLDYFKKYGSVHKYERAFAKLNPDAVGGTPEQRQRILFWKRYFALRPDQRPRFIHDHAEQYGIFIYGPLSQQEQDAREQAWLRRAHGAHFSQHQLDYLYVKPLLDFYFQLPKGSERSLFMEANPELEAWFQAHPPKIDSGNPHTDKLIEAYFKLDLSQRSAYLAAHPEIQTYFDKHSSPAQRAIHSILSQYFALSGRERSDFAAEHPEISAYFQARLLEKQNLSAATQALYEADPRLAPYRNNVEDMIGSAERQLQRLRAAALNSFTPDAIEANRDRTAYGGRSTGRHRAAKPASNVA